MQRKSRLFLGRLLIIEIEIRGVYDWYVVTIKLLFVPTLILMLVKLVSVSKTCLKSSASARTIKIHNQKLYSNNVYMAHNFELFLLFFT